MLANMTSALDVRTLDPNHGPYGTMTRVKSAPADPCRRTCDPRFRDVVGSLKRIFARREVLNTLHYLNY